MSCSFRAKWIFPVCRSPIRDGVISVRDGRIAGVQEYSAYCRVGNPNDVIDLGSVALLPGLVNAHTHLEFSNLLEPLGHHGIEFTKWIALVVAERMELSNGQAEAIVDGIRQSRTAGTIALGEIASNNWLHANPAIDECLGEQEVLVRVFLERLGNDESRHEEIVLQARQFANETTLRSNLKFGISPHAPYSVSLELLSKLTDVANKSGTPLAMHLAETEAEIELLDSGTGPFVELLRNINAWSAERFPPGCSVLDYLKVLEQSQHCLVVHGNYLNHRELDFIAERKQFKVVYCPRTHDFFDHQRYPLTDLLKRGIVVAVGTDSRASNPDLSIWSELRMIANKFPEVDGETILEMGTVNGAEALSLESEVGTLEAGKLARFVQVDIDECESSQPLESMLANKDNYPAFVAVGKDSGDGSG